ncbi:hypothetical protein [Epilithonimonas arachidiradicis]|uniref:Translation elongation factor EFTu/EF1A C-terminal domain-containing protein n=1 Tax=Epilithonimonas arachidiradicis TaxID=1617282 RepID=A0A420D9M3_9FLAO|nr:hypothetical protein [Epilithonimonas arachidiradicis]RKE87678.1 hypothetical protein BXY58_1809 [Epilithonimonas arachidiradicis]GGG57076.1 hypothetical protein GCM10007332_18460 [Epilithonimonas arachidiradicis]
MTAEEFVKNFYLEKQNILNSSFDTQSEFRSLVSTKIEELNLDEIETEKFKKIISNILDDTLYTILLGLDGSATIGNSQETFKIYDEENNLISDCGDLERLAYEYFHENKLETENSKCDFIAQINFKRENEGGRKNYVKSDYRSQLVFNFDDYQTSARQIYIGSEFAFPGDLVNAEIDLLSQDYFQGKLKIGMSFKLYEGLQLIGIGKIIKIINEKLNKL